LLCADAACSNRKRFRRNESLSRPSFQPLVDRARFISPAFPASSPRDHAHAAAHFTVDSIRKIDSRFLVFSLKRERFTELESREQIVWIAVQRFLELPFRLSIPSEPHQRCAVARVDDG